MNTIITRTISSQIRLFSTPIFKSNDIYKYIISKKKDSYKNSRLSEINEKDVLYDSSNNKNLSDTYKSYDSYRYMYNALPINEVCK